MSEDKKIETVMDLPGVGKVAAEKLAEIGLDSILSIAVAHPSTIKDQTSMSEASARKVIKAARDALGVGFVSGLEAEQTTKDKGYFISSGSKAFDNMIGGGIKSGIITEVFGQFGTGKTQIVHQVAVNTLKQYPDGIVVYIDTENTFIPQRIREMAYDADADDILSRIRYVKAFNSDHQIYLAEQIEPLVKKEEVRLIIVDSLMAHFRSEYVGRGTLADRQGKINKHMSTLSKVADLYDIPVLLTNQVMANPVQSYGNPLSPVGGEIVGHSSKVRIFVRRGQKGNEGNRVAKLIDHPGMPDGECAYKITERGLVDV